MQRAIVPFGEMQKTIDPWPTTFVYLGQGNCTHRYSVSYQRRDLIVRNLREIETPRLTAETVRINCHRIN